jgi:hypothetical protein
MRQTELPIRNDVTNPITLSCPLKIKNIVRIYKIRPSIVSNKKIGKVFTTGQTII